MYIIPPREGLAEDERLKHCWAINTRVNLQGKLRLEAKLAKKRKSQLIFTDHDLHDLKERVQYRIWERQLWDKCWCGTEEGCWWVSPQSLRPPPANLDPSLSRREERYFKSKFAARKLRKGIPRVAQLCAGVVYAPFLDVQQITRVQGLEGGIKVWASIYYIVVWVPQWMVEQATDLIRHAWLHRHGVFTNDFDLWHSSDVIGPCQENSSRPQGVPCSPEHISWDIKRGRKDSRYRP